MTATESPSWALSRVVRSCITCGGQQVNAETATPGRIGRVAANIRSASPGAFAGYQGETVRQILLDPVVTEPYPAEAPAAYAGR